MCAQWVAKDPSFLHADSELRSDWVDAQADLSLCWAHISFCWFCHEAAQMATTRNSDEACFSTLCAVLISMMAKEVSLNRPHFVFFFDHPSVKSHPASENCVLSAFLRDSVFVVVFFFFSVYKFESAGFLHNSHIYYPKVLTGHWAFIIFLRSHQQSHNSVCIPKQPNMSVKHTTKMFSIIQHIASRGLRWIQVRPFSELTRIYIVVG